MVSLVKNGVVSFTVSGKIGSIRLIFPQNTIKLWVDEGGYHIYQFSHDREGGIVVCFLIIEIVAFYISKDVVHALNNFELRTRLCFVQLFSFRNLYLKILITIYDENRYFQL